MRYSNTLDGPVGEYMGEAEDDEVECPECGNLVNHLTAPHCVCDDCALLGRCGCGEIAELNGEGRCEECAKRWADESRDNER